METKSGAILRAETEALAALRHNKAKPKCLNTRVRGSSFDKTRKSEPSNNPRTEESSNSERISRITTDFTQLEELQELRTRLEFGRTSRNFSASIGKDRSIVPITWRQRGAIMQARPGNDCNGVVALAFQTNESLSDARSLLR